MKNALIIIALTLSATIGFGQTQHIEQFFDKYSELEAVDEIVLKGWILKTAAKLSDEAEEKRLLERITELRLLVVDEKQTVSKSEIKGLLQSFTKDRFEMLLEVREKGDRISFFTREYNGSITDLVMLVHGKENFILASVKGLFSLDDIKQLNIEIEGMEHLKKVPQA